MSASGSLIPSVITVTGVDLDGQWLRDATTGGGPGLPQLGEGRWQFAHASPKGGYIVEEVTRTILGTEPDGLAITPSFIKYSQAGRFPLDRMSRAMHWTACQPRRRALPERTPLAVARFYEGLILPSAFAVGKHRTQAIVFVHHRSEAVHQQHDAAGHQLGQRPPLLKKFPIELFSEY